MCLAPLPKRLEDGAEAPTLVGEQILGARRVSGVQPALDDPVLLELLESPRENARHEAGERIGEVLKSPGALQEEVAENEDSPAIADDVESASDRTIESVNLSHGMRAEGKKKYR